MSAEAVKKYLKTLKNISIRIKEDEYKTYQNFCKTNNLSLRKFCLIAMNEYMQKKNYSELEKKTHKIDLQRLAIILGKENITMEEFIEKAINDYKNKDKKINELAELVRKEIINYYKKRENL